MFLMLKLSILVAEDNPLARTVMATHLKGHAVDFVPDFSTATEKIKEKRYNLCFIDLKLGEEDDDCSGLKLIPLAKSKRIYSIVMSGHDSEPYVEKAYELGCDDFYAKGNEETNVAEVLARFLQRREKPNGSGIISESFVTQDPETQFSIQEALKYAPAELPILILGPSGTGKTSLARLIHDHSGRSGELISINCAGYTDDLLEAELFGYKKGAFTGANDNRKGKLLMADQGTLFLDEIGTISLKMQPQLLKAIEERTFYPLGSEKPETSNFRIISATLEDIQSLVKEGRLRFDFFQRIHGFTLKLKPLAQRKDDIFPLISFFTRQGKRLAFTQEAKEEIARYDWPGNVRELKKLVDILTAGESGRVEVEAVKKLLNTLRLEEGTGHFVTEEQRRFVLREGMNSAIERFMDGVIERTLKANGGKRTQAISELKISTRLLYQSLRRQGISVRKNTKRAKHAQNQLIATP